MPARVLLEVVSAVHGFKQTAHGGRSLVLGCGDNPINFVSVVEVAAIVERVVLDSSPQMLEIGGRQNLSLNQLAAAVQHAAGRTSVPRQVPRAALHSKAVELRPAYPDLPSMTAAELLDVALSCTLK